MSLNNPGLYDAAYAGYIGGSLILRSLTAMADYVALGADAEDFAVDVDALIPTDPDLDQPRIDLMESIVTNAIATRSTPNGAALPTIVAMVYAQTLAGLVPWGGSGTVDNFQGYPLQAPTPPMDSQVYVWDGTQYDLRQLTADDLGPAFAITGFSGGSTVEIGATVTNPAFTASYSSLPASAHITNTDGIDSPLALTTPFTAGTVVGAFTSGVEADVTFTLTAVGATTQTATQAIAFEPRMFAGVAAAGATGATASGNNADLTGVGGVLADQGLTDNPVGSTYVVSPAAQKIYLLLTGGAHTFKDTVSGFPFPFNAPSPIAFVNQNGATVPMYLYESTNIVSATFDIQVVT